MVTNPLAVANALTSRLDVVAEVRDRVAAADPPVPEPVIPPTTPDFCVCGRCRDLPELRGDDVTENERRAALVCCGRQPCLTQTEVFRTTCLTPCVLRAALNRRAEHMFNFNAQHGPDSYRHLAYQQYIHYAYGWLGAKERKPVPACACWAIRDCYPSANGVYRGFRFAR